MAVSIALLLFLILAKTTFRFSLSDLNDLKNLIVTIVIAFICTVFENSLFKIFPKK
jgi:hypothetical protein